MLSFQLLIGKTRKVKGTSNSSFGLHKYHITNKIIFKKKRKNVAYFSVNI